MYKCLKITFTGTFPKGFLQNVLKCARDFVIEGHAQLIMENAVRIIVCGSLEHVDAFLDKLYDDLNQIELDELQVEPFAKDRDFRGVFRVLE